MSSFRRTCKPPLSVSTAGTAMAPGERCQPPHGGACCKSRLRFSFVASSALSAHPSSHSPFPTPHSQLEYRGVPAILQWPLAKGYRSAFRACAVQLVGLGRSWGRCFLCEALRLRLAFRDNPLHRTRTCILRRRTGRLTLAACQGGALRTPHSFTSLHRSDKLPFDRRTPLGDSRRTTS